MKKKLLTIALSVLALVGAGSGSSVVKASALPRCPRGVVTIVAGRQPKCDLHSGNQLNVRYPGSDGIERRKFLRMCNQVGCRRLVWFIPGGDISRGQWMFVDINF